MTPALSVTKRCRCVVRNSISGTDQPLPFSTTSTRQIFISCAPAMGAAVPDEVFGVGDTTCIASSEAMQSHECKFVPVGVCCCHWHQDKPSEVRLTFQAAFALSCNHG